MPIGRSSSLGIQDRLARARDPDVVDRHELKVAYLSELGLTNRTALAGAGKGTPMLRVVEDRDELLPLVRAGVSFQDGVRVEREDGQVTVLAKKGLSVNKEKRGKVAA